MLALNARSQERVGSLLFGGARRASPIFPADTLAHNDLHSATNYTPFGRLHFRRCSGYPMRAQFNIAF